MSLGQYCRIEAANRTRLKHALRGDETQGADDPMNRPPRLPVFPDVRQLISGSAFRASSNASGS